MITTKATVPVNPALPTAGLCTGSTQVLPLGHVFLGRIASARLHEAKGGCTHGAHGSPSPGPLSLSGGAGGRTWRVLPPGIMGWTVAPKMHMVKS